MKINVSGVAAAGAAIAACLAGQAQALTIANDGAPQVLLRVAGSSAMSKAFGAAVNAQLCQAGTNTVYWDDRAPNAVLGAEDGTRYQAYYCTAKAGITGIAAGARLLIVKRDRDGSLSGVGPVVNKEAIEFMTVDNTCADLGVAVAYPNPRFLCAGVENAIPDAGLSDVERALWGARGQAPQTVSGVTEVRSFFGQGFGIGVSNALYSALQAAQGLTVGATDVNNQPRIARTQYASIVSASGGYSNASFLTGVSGKLFVCRRPTTSGTQAVADAFFLDNPCQRNADPLFGQLLPRPAGTFGGGNLVVIENPGTADAINCLKDADPTVAGQEQAIGVVSLENTPSTGWKFVKLDGVSPNFYVTDPDGAGPLKRGDPDTTQRKNVILGHYLFAMEGSMLWRNDSAFAGATGALQLIANGLSSPSLASFNGVYSVRKQSATPPITHALFPDRVHKGSRGGNSCQNFQLFE